MLHPLTRMLGGQDIVSAPPGAGIPAADHLFRAPDRVGADGVHRIHLGGVQNGHARRERAVDLGMSLGLVINHR